MNAPRQRRLLVDHGDHHRIFEIIRDQVLIGRDEACDLRLNDVSVSRRHCEIRRISGLLMIEDLESANGTRVNGQEIRRKELVSGDRIQVGDVTIHVDEIKPQRLAAGTAPRAGASTGRIETRRKRSSSGVLVAMALLILGGGAFIAFQVLGGDDTSGHEVDSRPATPTEVRPPLDGQTPDRAAEGEPRRLPPPALEEPEDVSPRERFEDALKEGRFVAAESILRRMGRPADLALLLRRACARAVDAVAAEAARIRESEDAAAAARFLMARRKEFPPDSEAAARLDDLILSLPVASARNPEEAKPQEEAEGGGADIAARHLDLSEMLALADELTVKRELAQARSLYAMALEKARKENASAGKARAERGLRLVAAHEALIEALAKMDLPRGRKAPRVSLGGSRSGRLVGLDQRGIHVDTGGGKEHLKWRLVPARTLLTLVRKLPVDPMTLVHAAVVLFHAGDKDAAEGLLLRAWRKEPALKPAIDQALADARTIAVPRGGFTVIEGHWLTPQEVARSELDAIILTARKNLESDDPKKRREAFDTLRDLGDLARSSFHRGLLTARISIEERLRKLGAWKGLRALAARHEELVRRRRHALTLIRDTEKYPYPYRKERGASPEAVRNYQIHQPIVTERTRAVAEIWNLRLEVPIGSDFRVLVERMRELDRWLDEAGFDPARDDIAWVAHIPEEGSVTIRNFAASAPERERIDGSNAVLAANEEDPGPATAGERDQARITNEYRLMFGLWAVRLSPPLVKAAHDHCVDMVKHGFFAHNSPVKGKETPLKRARLAGAKPLGLGENIAINGSPQGAHNAWLHSPGHHRNILGEAWRIMGAGNSGNKWCQLFSAGDAGASEGQESGADGR